MIRSILIIEDDLDLQTYLRDFLHEHGYSVKAVSDGISALNLLKKHQPHLVILDLGLPNMTGESVCLEIKKNYPELKIIILTARDSVSDVVNGLNLGADDYISKPFKIEEVLARINARLREEDVDSPTLQVGDLVLNNHTLEVKRSDKPIVLTPQEFKLLRYLMANRGRVLTRDMILNHIWLSPDVETRVVDVYIGYLRKKIDSGFKKKLITSVRGFGYTLKD